MRDNERTELIEKLWTFVEPTIKGYGDMIDDLAKSMPIGMLKQFVESKIEEDT